MSGKARPFKLLCHPADSDCAALDLSGSVTRQHASLQLEYLLRGDMALLDIPAVTVPPRRRDELWRRTCFEAFITTPNEPGYWEFNLSPSGDWNCYRFSDYRRQMTQEPGIHALPCISQHNNEQLSLTVTLPLPPALAASPRLRLGISAVIRDQQGKCAYWALSHPGDQPDFHHRDSFTFTP